MEGTGQKQEFQNNPPSQTAEVKQPNHGIPSPQLGTGDKERENIRIQKAEWIYSQIQKQREAEDELFAQLRQEQDVLDNLCQSIENNMERTKEARRYNQEFQEHIDTQVYAMYGITEDKLQGIREYRNAYYQGCAFSLFLLSVVLVALCGFLHGFGSQICLFMIAFSGIEGALLAQGKQRGKALDLLCKALYLLMFPLMMAVFVCFELGYPEYRIMLPILAIFGICVLVLGTAAYFFYNPYRNEKKKASAAKDTIREIEKTARKEVRKNQKSREKSEKKQQKLLGRKAAKQQKQLEKEEKQQLKRLEKEEKQQQNLAYGKKDARREDVEAAAKAARIHRYIMSLPNGYDTILDENGINISQGQKQLLTIARAMLLDAKMLILDEATSNVDTRTEQQIQAAMRTLMKDKTCFVIAHRLSTIQNANNILVVRDGDIVEQGDHQALMAKNGFYASLYNSQFQ